MRFQTPMYSQTTRRLWPSTFISGSIVALSLALPLPHGDKIFGLPSPCLAQHLFHVPCPACGLTRAFVATAHGHLREAFAWHPLGPLFFGLTLAYTLWSLWAGAQGVPFRVSPKLQLASLGALGALMMVCWFLRIAGYFPLALT